MDSSVIIGEILDCLGVKAAEFARSIGVVPTQIYDLQKGKIKKISDSIADKIISAYPEFDKVWLLTGEGEMLKDGTTTSLSKAPSMEKERNDYETYLLPQSSMGGTLAGFPADGAALQNCEKVISPVINPG